MMSRQSFSKKIFTLPYGKFRFPPRKLLGKSIVGWSNILFFQWLFIRMGYNVNSNGLTFELFGFVLPMTGWWSDYKWIGKWR